MCHPRCTMQVQYRARPTGAGDNPEHTKCPSLPERYLPLFLCIFCTDAKGTQHMENRLNPEKKKNALDALFSARFFKHNLILSIYLHIRTK